MEKNKENEKKKASKMVTIKSFKSVIERLTETELITTPEEEGILWQIYQKARERFLSEF